MSTGSDAAGAGIGMLFGIIIVLLICGVIGMLTWPYTINTWGEYAHLDDSEDWNGIGKKGGFLLGICPVVGQFSIPAAIITGVCDMIFIPDGPKTVSTTGG